MTYEQALTLAGHLPTWELRAAVHQARDLAKHTRGHEEVFALAAQLVLIWRRGKEET